MEQRREDRAVQRNHSMGVRGTFVLRACTEFSPPSPAGYQRFLVAQGWILSLWHRSEDSWCLSAQPSPHLAAVWHPSPRAAELGEELCWMLIQQGNVVYFDMRLCLLSSLSTNPDDICFIFPLDRSCDTLQPTKPGWFLKWALQRMHLCEKSTLTVCNPLLAGSFSSYCYIKVMGAALCVTRISKRNPRNVLPVQLEGQLCYVIRVTAAWAEGQRPNVAQEYLEELQEMYQIAKANTSQPASM